MATLSPAANPEVLDELNTELAVIQGIEATTVKAMDNLNSAVGSVTSAWSHLAEWREEAQGNEADGIDLTGAGDLLGAAAVMPGILEERVSLDSRIKAFVEGVNAAITTKPDGTTVEGSIDPNQNMFWLPEARRYSGDDPDLPALFVKANNKIMGRVVAVGYSPKRYSTKSWQAQNRDLGEHHFDPVKATLWHPKYKDPFTFGLLRTSASLALSEKGRYELPDPDSYTPREV